MKTRLLIVLLCGLLFMFSSETTLAQKNGDWQLWGSTMFNKDLGNQLELVLEEEFRWAEDMDKFIYHASDIGIRHNTTEWLTLGANYRYVLQDDAGEWEHESRPHLNAIFKYSLFHLDLSNRNRLEYRYLTRTKDTWRYRNMLEIKLPLAFALFKVNPYVREEAFFNFDQDDYNQNRLSGGFEFTLIKNLAGELYYLRQGLKSRGKWKNVNVLGTKIKFIF